MLLPWLYLSSLLLGYILAGCLLAAYGTHPIVLGITYLVVLRLAQTGTAAIGIAIAWLVGMIWGGVFVWSYPKHLAVIAPTPQLIALLLLVAWLVGVIVIVLLAFARKPMQVIGIASKRLVDHLTAIAWLGMTVGWCTYRWLFP